MEINITYDASVASAPAGFKTALQAAVQYFETTFATPITVNISVGWGEVAGEAMVPGSIGESSAASIGLSYDEYRNALWANATTAEALASVNALPASDPTNGGTFVVSSAEAKALGLIDPLDAAIDGSIGLDASTSFTFDPNNRAIPGEVDAIGAIEHEISEVLGRASYLGYQPGDGESLYGPLDLFRYSSPGVLNASSANGSFSVTGQTLLLPFDNPLNGGDAGDWSQNVSMDSFDAFDDVGVLEAISATDLSVMDVLGYHPSISPPATPIPNVAPSALVVTSQPVEIAQGQNVYFTGTSQVSAYLLNYPIGLAFNNAGTLAVVGSQAAGLGVQEGTVTLDHSVVTNAATGVWMVASSGGWWAGGFFGGSPGSSDFVNDGVMQVVAPDGVATGVRSEAGNEIDPADGDVFQFAQSATGTLTVWGGAQAFGVQMDNSVQHYQFSNAGKIFVTGGATSVAATYASTEGIGFISTVAVDESDIIGSAGFVNTGTIKATNLTPQGISAGLEFSQVLGPLYNNGIIVGDYAIYQDQYRDPINYGAFSKLDFTNNGTLQGNILLDQGDDTFTNNGIIAGKIIFSDGNSTYNGTAGHLYGSIYLGYGSNDILAGSDNSIIYGGGNNDNITGGAGNDFFEIARGFNNIDGGAGFNIISFADSDMGVNADMNTGVATGAGTTKFKNIQEIIGSNYNNTLVAGSTSAILVAGDGQDVLIGGPGNDTLIAGTGGDQMTGGGGNNTFIFTSGDKTVTITDFMISGSNDQIDVYGYDSSTSIQQVGTDVVITLSPADSIILKNMSLSSIPALNIHYNINDYIGASTPPSLAVYGTNFLTLNQDTDIFLGENISPTNLFADLYEVAGHIFWIGILSSQDANTGERASFDNDGSIDIARSDEYNYVVGLLWEGTQPGGTLINDTAGEFIVSNPTGSAIGINPEVGDTRDPDVTNRGNFVVDGGSGALGLQTWDSSGFIFTNTSTGAFSVASGSDVARGLWLHNGGDVTNNGTMSVKGADVEDILSFTAAIYISNAFGSAVVNSGTISASASGASSAYGIVVTGVDDQEYMASIVNSGTITADKAIYDYNFEEISPGQAPSVNVTNTGTVRGDIDLGGSTCTVISPGKIFGNILLHDDNQYSGVGTGDTVDLRGGQITGYIGISAGWNEGTASLEDVIFGGSGPTLIKIASGEPLLTVLVTGGNGSETSIQYDIASSQATWAQNSNGSWTVNAGTDGTEKLTSVQMLRFTDKTIDLALLDDFTADGKSALLIENALGTVVIGQVVAGQETYAQISGLGAEWTFHGTGDFLGDGKADFLIENSVGAVVVGEVTNGQAVYTQVGGLGHEWTFEGTGDYLGDGKADFLIQNSAGAVVVGEVMNGQAVYTQVGGLGSEWSFHGAGDFLGDGRADFLIQNTGGSVVVGEVTNGQAAYTPVGGLGHEWTFVGVGDFLGDGRADFLIENSNGAVVAGEVVNGQAAYTQIAALGPEWTFKGAGDYLGEGHDQFLIENSNGALVIGDWTGGMIHYTQVGGLGSEWAFH